MGLSVWVNLRKLRSAKPEVRAAAALRLARRGAAGAVAGLCDLLQDEQRALRVAGAQALGVIGHSNAVGPLVTALLSEKQWDVRYEIVDALRKIGDPKAVNELLVLLDGGSADVGLQQVTTWALKEFGWDHLTPAQRAVVLTLRDEWNEIPKLGAAAIVPVIGAIKAGTHRQQMDGTDALARMNEPRAVESLLELLGDADRDIRRAAGTALERHAWTRLSEAQSALVAITLGKWSIAARCGTGAIDAVIATVREGTPEERQQAIETLGQIGGPRAAGLLGKALRDKQPDMRCAAARALSHCTGAEPSSELVAALDDEATAVRKEAARTLTSLGWAAESADEHVAWAAALGKWGEIAYLGVDAIDPILRLLQRPTMRQAAFEALMNLGEAAVDPLTRLLGDPNVSMRLAAAEAIGESSAKGAAKPLLQVAFQDGELAVRSAAFEALGKLGWQPAGNAENARMQIALERWSDMAGLGGAAIAPLMQALEDNRFSKQAGRAIEEILRSPAAPDVPIGNLKSLAALGEGQQTASRASASARDPNFQATITRRRLAQLARAELQRRRQPA